MKPLLWDSTEIDPFTGQPFTWDSPNPNVTWDGIREPGDAGYVPPPLSPKRNTQPTKKMKRNSWPFSGYTDTHPLPAAPVKWKYRAIRRVGDEQVGLWSEEVGITVGG